MSSHNLACGAATALVNMQSAHASSGERAISPATKKTTPVSRCASGPCASLEWTLRSKRELSGRSGAVGIVRDRRPRAPRCHRPRVNLAPRVSSLREVWDAGESLGKRGDPTDRAVPVAVRGRVATCQDVISLKSPYMIHIMSRHTVSQISSMLTVSPGVPWRYGRTGHAHGPGARFVKESVK